MITQKYLKSILDYDKDSGNFNWAITKSSKAVAGRIAGRKVNGYIKIGIDGKEYPAHRLAWLYVTGKFPKCIIDHINMVRDDNRWRNLRAATRSQNHFNRQKQKNNTSGKKGVYHSKRDKLYFARTIIERKHIFIGSFKTLEEAGDAYDKYCKEHHGEFFRNDDIQIINQKKKRRKITEKDARNWESS